jgi:hypothetical protein
MEMRKSERSENVIRKLNFEERGTEDKPIKNKC